MTTPFNPSLHPRAPSGAPGGIGGQFISHTLVRSHWLPTGQRVSTTGLSGNKLAAANQHNAAVLAANPAATSAPHLPPSHVIPVKASAKATTAPAGLSLVQGYYFPTGIAQSLVGLSGTRRTAAIAHNAAVAANPGASGYNQVGGYWFPNGHLVVTSHLTGAKLAAANTHNASQAPGAPVASRAQMLAARQAAGAPMPGATPAVAVPSPPPAPAPSIPAPRAPTPPAPVVAQPATPVGAPTWTQVGAYFMQVGKRYHPSYGAKSAERAAVQQHNAALPITAPYASGDPVGAAGGYLPYAHRNDPGLTTVNGHIMIVGAPVQIMSGMSASEQAAINAHNATFPHVAPAVPAGPQPFTAVGSWYFPTGFRVNTAHMTGAKLAAANKHNASVSPTAPISYGQPIPVKAPVSGYGAPQGMVKVQGYYFPAGIAVPTKGLAGTRKQAATAHNAYVASPHLPPPPSAAPWNMPGHTLPPRKSPPKSTTFVPVDGQDIRGSEDWDRIAAMTPKTKAKGDQHLWEIYKAQGYHAVPEQIDQAEMDKRLANGEGWVELFRGLDSQPHMTSQEMADQLRSGHQHYAGFGIYGNGSYSGSVDVAGSSYTSRATRYAGPGAGAYGIPAAAMKANGSPDLSHPYWASDQWPGLVRMAMRPDARIITESALARLVTNLRKGSPASYKSVLTDPGHMAAALGYDVLVIDKSTRGYKTPYHVILNRTAVAMMRV